MRRKRGVRMGRGRKKEVTCNILGVSGLEEGGPGAAESMHPPNILPQDSTHNLTFPICRTAENG